MSKVMKSISDSFGENGSHKTVINKDDGDVDGHNRHEIVMV